MTRDALDSKKLYQLGSHPGTFPEMIQSTYYAGLEAGKDEGKKEREQETAAALRRGEWLMVLIATFVSVMWLACLLVNCVVHAGAVPR